MSERRPHAECVNINEFHSFKTNASHSWPRPPVSKRNFPGNPWIIVRFSDSDSVLTNVVDRVHLCPSGICRKIPWIISFIYFGRSSRTFLGRVHLYPERKFPRKLQKKYDDFNQINCILRAIFTLQEGGMHQLVRAHNGGETPALQR